MDRRSFLAWSALSPVSVAAGIAKRRRYRQPLPRPGGSPVPTGLIDLDHVLRGGLTPSAVTLLGTTPEREIGECLALAVTDHHLRRSEGPVAFVTRRLSREDAVWLLAASRSGAGRHTARRGLWKSEEDRKAYEAAYEGIEASALHYESIRRLRPLADLERSLGRVHESHPLTLVVIDDVTGLKDMRCASDREMAAARVGRRLRDLARSIRVPVLAACPFAWLTQLNAVSDPDPLYVPPDQTNLGPLMPILDFCDAFLVASPLFLARQGRRYTRIDVRVEFHPRASTGSCSCHTIDHLTGRVHDGA